MPAAQPLVGFLRRHRELLLSYLAPLLSRARLLGPSFRLYERLASVGAADQAVDERGLAIPPAYLRFLVVGTTTVDGFLETGRQDAELIRGFFAEDGLVLGDSAAVLDFGCGCGRVARWWPTNTKTEWHGCDFNPRLVAWCAEHLPHVQARVGPVAPPTTYAAGRFDAIYAISVFTHWPEPLQHAWLGELMRLLRPGGKLLFTTHGEARLETLVADEQARFDRGELVVRFGEEPGSNLCVAFHPPAWTRASLLAGRNALHRPAAMEGQDVWVATRPP